VRGSGRWTLDFLIGRRGSLRAFSSTVTYATEREADTACWTLGRRIIDRSKPDCSVKDLEGDDERLASEAVLLAGPLDRIALAASNHRRR
jgi:hypothetical protein